MAPDHRLYQVRGQLFFVSTIYSARASIFTTIQLASALKGSSVEVLGLNPESTNLFARIGIAPEAGGRGGTPIQVS